MGLNLKNLLGVRFAVFPYGNRDPKEVAAQGARVLRNPQRIPKRKSESRTLAFHAGRAAVAGLFQALQVEAFVEPDPFFGYLNAVRADGSSFPGLFVNISHTEQLAVAAASSFPIGIDVESVYRDASRAVTRVSNDYELRSARGARLEAGGQPLSGEVALWSAKEAVSKAVGLGIKFGMQDFVVGLAEGKGPPFSVELLRQGPLKLSAPAVSFARFEHFVIAICSEEPALRLGLNEVPLEPVGKPVNRE